MIHPAVASIDPRGVFRCLDNAHLDSASLPWSTGPAARARRGSPRPRPRTTPTRSSASATNSPRRASGATRGTSTRARYASCWRDPSRRKGGRGISCPGCCATGASRSSSAACSTITRASTPYAPPTRSRCISTATRSPAAPARPAPSSSSSSQRLDSGKHER